MMCATLPKWFSHVMMTRLSRGPVYECHMNAWKILCTETEKCASRKEFDIFLTITYSCGNVAHFI